jgi:Zn-dependent protease with chaperone function
LELADTLPRGLPVSIEMVRLALAVMAGFGASWLATSVGLRAVLLRPAKLAGTPWWERARRHYPAQVLSIALPIWAGLTVPLVHLVGTGPFDLLPRSLIGWLAGISAYLGGSLAAAQLWERVTGYRRGWLEHGLGQLWIVFLLVPQVPLLVLMTATIGPNFDLVSSLWAVLAFLGFTVSVWLAGLPLGQLLGVVTPAPDALLARVEAVADRVGMRPKRVYVIEVPIANAFALPFSGRIGLTARLVDELDEEAFDGIVAHELGHLCEGRDILVPRLVSHFALYPIGLSVPIYHHFGLLGMNIAFLLCIGAMVLAARARRHAEAQADAFAHAAETGAGLAGRHYARGLETLHRVNSIPAVMWGRPEHPHLCDRLVAAGVPWEGERPQPPRLRRLVAGVLLTVPLFALSFSVAQRAPVWAGDAILEPELASYLRIASSRSAEHGYFQLMRVRMSEGRNAEALRFVDEAIRARPEEYDYEAARASLLARLGRCDLALESYRAAVAGAGERATSRWIAYAGDALQACPEERLSSLD